MLTRTADRKCSICAEIGDSASVRVRTQYRAKLREDLKAGSGQKLSGRTDWRADQQSDELLRRIHRYEDEKPLRAWLELVAGKKEARWQQTATALKRWEEETSPTRLGYGGMKTTIDLETLERLKKRHSCVQIRKNIRKLPPLSESSKSRKSRQR